jgi:hypothetical protein
MFFKILFTLHAFVTAIVGLSLVTNLLRQNARTGQKRKDIKINLLLFLVFAGTLYLVWYLKQHENQSTATWILVAIWVVALIMTLYALSKVRWN